MKRLILIRGLPGSGKTTLAGVLKEGYKEYACVHYEADQYFTQHGEYFFDPRHLAIAHKTCMDWTAYSLQCEVDVCIVSNTFTQLWELEPYIELAKKFGYSVQFITCEGNFKNIHNVPQEKIEQMRSRWEHLPPP